MQSVKNIAVTRKASEVKKAIHEVKEEYAKIENLVQDNEEEKEQKRRIKLVTNEFAEASAELIEILRYIPKTEVEKIPLKLRGFFEDVSKPNYNVRIDPRKPLEEQDLKEKTKDLITVIYRNYWCTEEEKQILDKQLLENDKKYEEELRKKYDPDKLFEKNTKVQENEDTKELIKYEKHGIIYKLFSWIRRIFKR